MNGGELLGYGSRTMGGETGGLSIGAGGENYAYGFTGDNPAKMEMILRKNAQTLADISNEPVWVEINKKVIDIIMPTKEPLLLTEGIYANGRLLLNPANEEGESFVAIGSAIRENPPTEFLKSYNAFVDDQPLLTKVAQSIDPEASAINFLATKNTPPALMSFKLNADGDIVLDHIPLTHVTQESLETKVQTVLMQLEQKRDLETRLIELYDEQALASFLRSSGLSDKQIQAEITKVISADGELMTGGGKSVEAKMNSYRTRTSGGETELPEAVLINQEHLESQRQAVAKVIEDIQIENPADIILSGRGGYPFEAAVREHLPESTLQKICTSSCRVPEGELRYGNLERPLNQIIQMPAEPTGPIKVAIIDGAEYSSDSMRRLKTFLETNFKRTDNMRRPLEITVYTFPQNYKAQHFKNLGQLTIDPEMTTEIVSQNKIGRAHV